MDFDIVYKKRVEIEDLDKLKTQLAEIVENKEWVSTED